VEAPQTKRKAGQKVSAIERMDYVSRTKELMYQGYNSIRAIAVELGVSADTASSYRKQALHAITNDPAPSQANVRLLQFNRLGVAAEQINEHLSQAVAEKTAGKAVSWQSIAALHNSKIKAIEAMNRIMGLNTDVNVNYDIAPQQLVIIKSRDETASA
jgi:hypothetical protein